MIVISEASSSVFRLMKESRTEEVHFLSNYLFHSVLRLLLHQINHLIHLHVGALELFQGSSRLHDQRVGRQGTVIIARI